MAPPFTFPFARSRPICLRAASGEIDTDMLNAISIYNGVGLVKEDGSEQLKVARRFSPVLKESGCQIL
jgi:hypothetical protein